MKEFLCTSPEMEKAIGSRGGGSAIIGPRGEYIAGPIGEKEEILYADIDISKVAAHKGVHDVCGHYQRHDVFSLTVNEAEPQLFRTVAAPAGPESEPVSA
jgi:predicted amidohydrolase